MTENNLGVAARLGERQPGAAGARSLTEAVDVCREALGIHTREDLPQQWAMTQYNLGEACEDWVSEWVASRALRMV